MANDNLTAMPFSRNDVSRLANLFKVTFHSYCLSPAHYRAQMYLADLRMIVGLGFTAALVAIDREAICCYRSYLPDFRIS